MEYTQLIVPAFVAGLFTFLAPCTLPLVPGYLGFISGVSLTELQREHSWTLRRRVFLNGVFYVLGFSFVFILFGLVFGLGGVALVRYRFLLMRIGGLFVIFFGLYMLGVFHLRFLEGDKHLRFAAWLTPGRPLSSFLFGATFAFGWSPCIGPVLGTILLLSSFTGTALAGGMLLFIFSLGLAIPFLVIAFFLGSMAGVLKKIHRFLPILSKIGGAFLLFLGIVLVSNRFLSWIGWVYQFFSFMKLEERLLRFF